MDVGLAPEGSSSSSSRNYDVFLSFGGEEGTAKSFTDRLFTALVQAGFGVFRDNNNDDTEKGAKIRASEIEKAIETSRISIIVFSEDWASSKRCFEEFAKILKGRRIVGVVVLPVYYGVDPSEIEESIEAFGRYDEGQLQEEEEEEEEEEEIIEDQVRKGKNTLSQTSDVLELLDP